MMDTVDSVWRTPAARIAKNLQLSNPYKIGRYRPSHHSINCTFSLLPSALARLGRTPVRYANTLAISLCGHSRLSSQLISKGMVEQLGIAG